MLLTLALAPLTALTFLTLDNNQIGDISALAGMTVAPMVHEVDARWIMAYAAALGDHRPEYFDTLRPDGIVAHPLFAVCPEWPVIVSSRVRSEELGITRDEVLTGVHADHVTRDEPGVVLREKRDRVRDVLRRRAAHLRVLPARDVEHEHQQSESDRRWFAGAAALIPTQSQQSFSPLPWPS